MAGWSCWAGGGGEDEEKSQRRGGGGGDVWAVDCGAPRVGVGGCVEWALVAREAREAIEGPSVFRAHAAQRPVSARLWGAARVRRMMLTYGVNIECLRFSLVERCKRKCEYFVSGEKVALWFRFWPRGPR